ncbi:transmembrane protein 68 [Folsomia candida]|uniref:transmembrane protein 68 n=1 Tax=Folsomia candida TaxID=158441 RepID=UPI001604D364|nr:transmembrane protein 68 [Folsomia candida]
MLPFEFLPDLDTDYYKWLKWLVAPILIAHILPAFVAIFFTLSSLYAYVYTIWIRVGQIFLAKLWNAQARIWHGYEVEGIDNIPKTGPAIIIHYHGTVPIDVYYLIAKCVTDIGRLLSVVADRSLFKIPGWASLLKFIKATPGGFDTCLGILNAGDILIIAPGGAYELQFSDNNYKLKWKNRVGFAKLALAAKVPIIPMFTKNIREAYRNVTYRFRHWFYATTNLTFVPMYGFFPVKLKCYIGKAMPYDANNTPEMLAQMNKSVAYPVKAIL